MPSEGRNWRRNSRTAAKLLLCVLIFWAPIPLGSNRSVFWALNGLIGAIMLVFFIAGEWNSERGRKVAWAGGRRILAVLAVVLGWMLLQSATWTPSILHHPLWGLVAEIGGTAGAISVNPAATLAAACQLALAIAVAAVAARVAADAGGGRLILRAALLSTTLVALYGLIVTYTGANRILWLERWAYEDYLTGTFVNRNTVATFFAFGIATAFAMIIGGVDAAQRQSGRGWLKEFVTALPHASGFLVLVVAVLFIAILETGSRAGAGAAIVGMVVVLMARFGTDRRAGRAAVTLGALVALGGLLVLAGDRLLDRLAVEGVSLDTRLSLYRDTIEMIRQRPLLGHGAGAFADVFPTIHRGDTPADITLIKAHNTYLEGAAGLGLPAAALMLGGLGLAVVFIWRARASGIGSGAALASIGVAAAAAAHSLLDFSLQTQAVTLLFAALLGAGYGDASSIKAEAHDQREPGGPVLGRPPPGEGHEDGFEEVVFGAKAVETEGRKP